MKCRSSFHSIQRVSEPQLKAPMSMIEESITQTLGYGESTFNWNTNYDSLVSEDTKEVSQYQLEC